MSGSWIVKYTILNILCIEIFLLSPRLYIRYKTFIIQPQHKSPLLLISLCMVTLKYSCGNGLDNLLTYFQDNLLNLAERMFTNFVTSRSKHIIQISTLETYFMLSKTSINLTIFFFYDNTQTFFFHYFHAQLALIMLLEEFHFVFAFFFIIL